MMTAAEGIAELRGLIAEQLQQPVVNTAKVKMMLWDICYIAEDGYVNELIALRLRRYRRRSVSLRRAGLHGI